MSWTQYVKAIKEAHPDLVIDYKALMQKYITGVSWEDAV